MADLKSASLLNTAAQKLPPNMKVSWSLITVQKHWVKPTPLDFNDWLKQKSKTLDLMKQTTIKAKTEDNTNSITKIKVDSRTFAAITHQKAYTNCLQMQQHPPPMAALYVQETIASGSVAYLRKSLPLSEPK